VKSNPEHGVASVHAAISSGNLSLASQNLDMALGGWEGGSRLPIGAEVLATGGVRFRVWAPRCRAVEVVLEGEAGSSPHEGESATALTPEGNGYFSGVVGSAGPGTRYRYRLDAGEAFPDPASRFQPHGPHGPSVVVDPAAFRWSDAGWQGLRIEGQVLHELHIGSFTHEGT
jgi:maltooligosyltrehalose trehalohydrolase